MSNDIFETRKANLRVLIEEVGGPNNLAKRLSLKTPSFLSHLAGPRPSRHITERSARKIETAMNLTKNWLDSPVGTRITFAPESPKLQLIVDTDHELDDDESEDIDGEYADADIIEADAVEVPATVVETQHQVNVMESALDQNRLASCIEKVISKGNGLTSKQLSKIIFVIYSSPQNVDELDNTVQSLVDLAKSL